MFSKHQHQPPVIIIFRKSKKTNPHNCICLLVIFVPNIPRVYNMFKPRGPAEFGSIFPPHLLEVCSLPRNSLISWSRCVLFWLELNFAGQCQWPSRTRIGHPWFKVNWFKVILMDLVIVGKDQGQGPSREEKGGAAETAGWPEGGTVPAQSRQGYWWSCLQTL